MANWLAGPNGLMNLLVSLVLSGGCCGSGHLKSAGDQGDELLHTAVFEGFSASCCSDNTSPHLCCVCADGT